MVKLIAVSMSTATMAMERIAAYPTGRVTSVVTPNLAEQNIVLHVNVADRHSMPITHQTGPALPDVQATMG